MEDVQEACLRSFPGSAMHLTSFLILDHATQWTMMTWNERSRKAQEQEKNSAYSIATRTM